MRTPLQLVAAHRSTHLDHDHLGHALLLLAALLAALVLAVRRRQHARSLGLPACTREQAASGRAAAVAGRTQQCQRGSSYLHCARISAAVCWEA